jgi:phage tail sheath protein FI
MSTINPSNPAPGVYGYVKDLSERPANVATSVAAFVGATPKGPVGERTLITDFANYKATFGFGGTEYGYMAYSVEPFLNQSSRCYVTRVVNGALTAGSYFTTDDTNAQDPQLALSVWKNPTTNNPEGANDPLNSLGFTPTTPGVGNILGYFCAANPGDWNNGIVIEIRPSNPPGVALRGNGHDPLKFYVDVYLSKAGAQVQPDESFLVTRHQETDEEGTQLFIEDVINKKSNIIRVRNNEFCPEIPIVNTASCILDGGDDGLPPTENQIIDAWDLYSDPEEIEVDILVNGGYTHYTIHHALNSIAEGRGDAIAILDMPSDMQEVADAVNYKRNILNLSSYYSALYSADIKVYDYENDLEVYVPPSGYVAAAFAKADSTRALWFAPAGIDLGTLDVLGVRVQYDQGARDSLDMAQINPIRKMRDGSYVIWGQQTTQTTATSFQYVNVVRLVNYVLKRAKASTLSSVFNPNDSVLRDRVKATADSILEPIRRGRGVYEYQNVCDDRNNTNDTIANGDLVLDMVFDPVIAAKRIHVVFNINPTGSRATEA